MRRYKTHRDSCIKRLWTPFREIKHSIYPISVQNETILVPFYTNTRYQQSRVFHSKQRLVITTYSPVDTRSSQSFPTLTFLITTFHLQSRKSETHITKCVSSPGIVQSGYSWSCCWYRPATSSFSEDVTISFRPTPLRYSQCEGSCSWSKSLQHSLSSSGFHWKR